jgi:uncharacterized protein (DUF3084 family)
MHKQKPDKQQDDVTPDLLQKALHELLEQISKRDQKIAERDALLRFTRAQLKEREAQFKEQEAEIMERKAQIHEIRASRTWKIALLMQRIRTFFVPINSRRAQILERGLKMILSPFTKIKRN